MSKGRIPQALNPFNLYFKRFINWLTTIKTGQTDNNAKRNGISTAEVSAFQAIYAKWYTGDPTNPGFYELHTNPATKTKVTGVKMRSVKKDFSDKAYPVLDRISGSENVEDDDLEILNIAKKRGSHHPHDNPIEANTFIRHKMLGPGKVKIGCYANESGGRPRIDKAAGADSVQFAICIIAPNNQNKANENSGKVKREEVSTVDECPYREIHTSATIVLSFEMEYRKCDVHIYARQYYIANPEIAGSWSEVLTITIP